MKFLTRSLSAAVLATALSAPAMAADYKIDDAHTFIEFKISHLGISWLNGRFNKFSGDFSYDAKKPSASDVNITIDTESLDSNHAERDKHLRSKDFLYVSEYPEAEFKSTSFKEAADGSVKLKGDFTLHGVTKSITLDAKKTGEGKDPWGGYRVGFAGTTEFQLKDFGIDSSHLGPASETVYMNLYVEGVRKD